MTDRDIQKDKLIELVDKAKEEYANDITDHTETDYIVETLLNEGAILPPCKVGDVVYEINTKYPKASFINRFIVIAFHITSGENILGHKKPSHAVVGVDYLPSLTKRIYLDHFGKTVFLTKEEAEAELRKRSEHNA